ncbi:MAG: hypothetical protein ABW142_11400 [Thermoleophilaceae bacterium]|jgi:hypothetical protein
MGRLVRVIVLVGIAGTGHTMLGGVGRDSFDGNEPDPPDEEKGEVLAWEGPNMSQEPNCFSANPCPP